MPAPLLKRWGMPAVPSDVIYSPIHLANSTARTEPIELVVLHETGLAIEFMLRALAHPIGTGYHYAIAKSGELYVLTCLERFIWAARPSFYHGRVGVDPVAVHIALETCWPLDYTDAQYLTLSALLAALKRPHVLHRDIHTGRQVRDDPRGFEPARLSDVAPTRPARLLPPHLDTLLYSNTGSHDPTPVLAMGTAAPLILHSILYYCHAHWKHR